MIDVCLSNEYGSLRTVVMRYAGAFTTDLSRPELLDPVFRRQLETSSWKPYNTAVARSQQDVFMEVLRSRAVEVLLAEDVPGSYSQHYTRDIGFVIDGVFFLARLNSVHCQCEIVGIR